jgi:amino acid transporter
VYGVTFITLGNLAGNSIALGIYVLQAAGYHSDHLPAAAARGLAIAALTLSCVIHAVWRRGGIMLNNILAFLKVILLLSIVVLGLAAIAGVSFGHGKVDAANLDPHTSFSNPRSDVVSYMDSIPFIIYSLHGFKQPFYVSQFSFHLMTPC